MKYTFSQIKKNIKKYNTKNLVYRIMDVLDIYPFYNQTQNENFMKYLYIPKNENIKDFNNFFKEKIKEIKNSADIWITILEKSTLEVVGFIRMSPYNNTMQAGVYIFEKFWNTRYAIEAIKYGSSIYFKYSKENYYYIFTDKENIKTIKIIRILNGEINGEMNIKEERQIKNYSNKYNTIIKAIVFKNRNSNIEFKKYLE